jgi:hypothetical protein
MLKLRKGKPPFVPVPLGGGAIIRVRAATQSDVEYASARATPLLAGLVAGAECAPALAGALGDDFNVDALTDEARLRTAAVRLSEIYLVLACQDGWAGVGNEDGSEASAPDAATIALLLQDPVCRNKVMQVVNAAVHAEDEEKNASSASPSGGADIPIGALPADATPSPAPGAAASRATTASPAGARRSRIRPLHAKDGQSLS